MSVTKNLTNFYFIVYGRTEFLFCLCIYNVFLFPEISSLSACKEVCLTTLPAPKEDPTSKILLALKSTYTTSFLKQFATLTRRSLLVNISFTSTTITTTTALFRSRYQSIDFSCLLDLLLNTQQLLRVKTTIFSLI